MSAPGRSRRVLEEDSRPLKSDQETKTGNSMFEGEREDREALGGLLRRWRERAMLTQEELARRSGLSVRTVRRMEGGRPPRARSSSLRLVGEALDLDEGERARLAAVARGVAQPAARAAPQFEGCGSSWGAASRCRWPASPAEPV
ncbi:helix-turn-helix domain-containing protein [Nonomuraea typhae]|uniref:Helix-turn-helix domain-containing protein n=1 Tax=Nonomuraea typhae TaxID=2603600 RepID=A0ABW7ZCG9_9ACTN